LQFKTKSNGNLYLSNLSINYRHNTPPKMVALNDIEIYEDCGTNDTGKNLSTVFYDDSGLANLVTNIYGSNSTTVEMWISSSYHIMVKPALNFFGVVSFNISATDSGRNDISENGAGDDRTVFSNDFTVTIYPTDDAPEIVSLNSNPVTNHTASFLGKAGATEDKQFVITIQTRDIDGDPVVLSTNSTLDDLTLDRENSRIVFQPVQEDVGFHRIKVIATELNYTIFPRKTDYVNITIEVTNVNEPPIVKYLELNKKKITVDKNFKGITIKEDARSVWYIKCYDEDNDTLTFTTLYKNDNFQLDGKLGMCTFTPVQADVGFRSMDFYINDGHLKTPVRFTMSVTVQNVNDRPVPKPITYTGGVTDQTVSFSTEPAFDEDSDLLTYTWDFGDGLTGSGRSAEHIYEHGGEYKVVLSVTDSNSPAVQEIMNITVASPVGPIDDDIDMTDTDGDGMPDSWERLYGLDTNTNDSYYDNDGDRYSNLQEFLEGTDPIDPNSYPGAQIPDDDDTEPVIPNNNVTIKTNGTSNGLSAYLVPLIIGMVVLLVVIVIVIFLVKRKKGKSEEQNPPLNQ
jgi:hypothetical protein